MKDFQRPEHPIVSKWGTVDSVLLFIVFILVVAFAGSTVHRWFFQKTILTTIDKSIVKIQVLNGCGDKGAAEQVTQVLRKSGFDVLFYGNADSFDHQQTLVIDHRGRQEFAKLVAEEINCQNVMLKENDRLRLDVTVILGKDWKEKITKKKKIGILSFLDNIFNVALPFQLR